MTIQCKASLKSKGCLGALLLTMLLPGVGWADGYFYTGYNNGNWDGTHLVVVGFPPKFQNVPNWHDPQSNTDANFPPDGNSAGLLLGGSNGTSNVTVNFNHSYSGYLGLDGLTALVIDSNNTLSQTSASSGMLASTEVVGGSGSSGTYLQAAGGNLTGALTLGQNGTSGTYRLSGGSLSVNGTEVIADANSAYGTFNQTGGSHTVKQLILAHYGGDTADFNLSGGTLTVNGDETVGNGYTASTGTFTQSGNSMHTITGTLYLAPNSGGQSAFNLQGGTLTVSGDEVVGRDPGSFGAFTQSGTSMHTVKGTLFISQSAGAQGTFTLQNGVLTAGTVQLNPGGTFAKAGGTMIVTTFNQAGGAVYVGLDNRGTFNYSGGTFNAYLNSEGTVNFNADFTAVYGIQNYGLLVIPAGRTVTSGGNLINSGTLTLAGGTLVLSTDPSATNFNNPTGTFNCDPTHAFHLGAAKFGNNGTLNLNGSLIDGTGILTNYSLLTGYGIISSPFSNGGTMAVQGGTLNVTQPFASTGQIQISSGASLAGGTLTNTGAIHGSGMVFSNVENNSGGTIEPVAGILSFTGVLHNNAGGTINAAAGNKLLVTLGIATNAGTINLSGGTFDNNGHTLNNTGTIVGYGTVSTGGLTNNGSALFTGGGGASIAGDVTNNSTVHVTKTTVTFAGSYTENGTYISDPSDNYFRDLTVGAGGVISAGAGDRFFVAGNFTNNSTQAGTWNTSAAQLSFQGGAAHQLKVAGPIGSFAWGTLTVDPGNMLVLAGNSATAAATVNNGTLTHSAGAASLGTITGTGNLSVGNPVGAAVNLNAVSLAQGSLSIGATGTVALADNPSPLTSTLNSLTISGGKLDLADNSLQINYGGGPSPMAAVRAKVTSGYAGGAWNGPGIDTSAADASHELGYADSGDGVVKNLPPNAVLVRYTTTGDADLDGKVDFNDLVILARHYNQSNANWDQGDFNYDGTVGFDDLVSLARNYAKGLSASQLAGFDPAFRAEVERAFPGMPEPSGLGATILAAATLVRRRRRSSKCTPGN